MTRIEQLLRIPLLSELDKWQMERMAGHVIRKDLAVGGV